MVLVRELLFARTWLPILTQFPHHQYAVGLCLPIRFLPSYKRDLFTMANIRAGKAWLFALRGLMACYAIATIVPESKQVLKGWYTSITGGHYEFERVTAVTSTLAVIQAIPRQDSFLGEIGMRCLIILHVLQHQGH